MLICAARFASVCSPVRIDDEINNQRFSAPTTISTNDSSIAVMVVPTNEELAIARQALTLI